MLSEQFKPGILTVSYASVFFLGLFLYWGMMQWGGDSALVNQVFSFCSNYVPMLPRNIAYAPHEPSAKLLQVYFLMSLPFLAWVSFQNREKFFTGKEVKGRWFAKVSIFLIMLMAGVAVFCLGLPPKKEWTGEIGYFFNQCLVFIAAFFPMLMAGLSIFRSRKNECNTEPVVATVPLVAQDKDGSIFGNYESKPFRKPYRIIFEVTARGIMREEGLIPWHEIRFIDEDSGWGVIVYGEDHEFLQFPLRTFGKEGANYKAPGILSRHSYYQNKTFNALSSFVFDVLADPLKNDRYKAMERKQERLIAELNDPGKMDQAASEYRRMLFSGEIEEVINEHISEASEKLKLRDVSLLPHSRYAERSWWFYRWIMLPALIVVSLLFWGMFYLQLKQ